MHRERRGRKERRVSAVNPEPDPGVGPPRHIPGEAASSLLSEPDQTCQHVHASAVTPIVAR